MAQTTLCVTAGNDAAWIGRCLASAQDVVDEAVVVTVGSTDGTAEVARRAGATVIEGRPPDSHAEWSNLPIAHARGSWILCLRADEVLDAAARSRWPSLGGIDADGVLFAVRAYAFGTTLKWRRADPRAAISRGAMGWMPREEVRLFRRRADIRFAGRIAPTVRPAIEAANGSVIRSDVAVHAYRWLRLLLTDTDRRMADAGVNSMGRSTRDWIELGLAQLEKDRTDEARASFERAFAGSRDPDAAFFLAHLSRAEPDTAGRLLAIAVDGNRDNSSAYFDCADALEQLALVRERLGDTQGAIALNREALAQRPDSPVALHHLAGLLIGAGALDEAERLVEQGLARDPWLSAFWSLRAALDLRHRRITGARRSLAAALECDPMAKPAQRALDAIDPARRCAAAARTRPAVRVERLAPGGVVSIIGTLGGGAGRVAADIALALAWQRDQVLLTLDEGREWGQGYHVELRRANIPVVQLDTPSEILQMMARLGPAVVVQHSWLEFVDDPVRVGNERWVAIGHDPAAMPHGYDAYINLSGYQAAFQSHLPSESMLRIPNGVDLDRFPETRRPGDQPVTIAVLSRLTPEKFARRFLEYLPDLTALDVRVLVAGRGPRRLEIEPDVRAAGLADRIRFVGPVPSTEVPGFLLAADIGLHLTETWEEVHSLAILEMLAAQLPIVSQPRGCLPELVRSGVNGFLAEDELDVRAAIERLAGSAELRGAFGRRSREVAQAYGIPIFAARYRELIDRLTADGGHR